MEYNYRANAKAHPYRRCLKALYLLLAAFLGSTGQVIATVDEDVAAIREAVVGEGLIPVPPSEDASPASIHGELRAQTLQSKQNGQLLCVIAGMCLFGITVGQIKFA